MTRKNDKRVYTIKEIKPIEDPSKFNMAFPILFPNTDYFKDLNSILNSYGIVLKNLSDVNYDIEEYFKNIKENPILNCIVKNSNFKVSVVDDGTDEDIENSIEEFNNNEDIEESEGNKVCNEDIEEDNEYIDIVVSDNNEIVFGIKYNSTKYILEDFDEETNYDISLFIDLDFLNFFFTGSYCFIDDKKYGRKYFVYLD
jgi:hypothetical protein